MNIEEHKNVDRRALARELAESVANDLRKAVTERGGATLVVSGGSTPEPFLDALSKIELDWAKVTVTLADERWVDSSDAASNEAFVRRHLLRGVASPARFVALKNAAETPEEGQKDCEAALHSMALPIDVVVLGMGSDGHTASLFPDAAELAAGLDRTTTQLCLAVRPPEAPNPRMSLTLAALLLSRRIVLHITGEKKWQVYQQAITDGPEEELPIRAVLRNADNVEVWWAL